MVKTLKFKLSLLCSLLCCYHTVFAVIIPYGNNGSINYNLKTGTFSVIAHQEKIITKAYSQVRINGKLFSSKDDRRINYTVKAIKTGFGNGKAHTFLLSRKGSPTLKQVFYVYDRQDYFLFQLTASGQALRTNDMEPIVAQLAPKTYTNSLFVPFDNDTFISYDAKPLVNNLRNTSAEVSAVYNNELRNGLVLGSVTHDLWKTGITTTQSGDGSISIAAQCGYTEVNLTRDQIAHGMISGDQIKSAQLFIGYQKDWRLSMEAYAKANRTAEPPIISKHTAATPVGWNSWGAMQTEINENNIKKVVDFFADSLPIFRSGSTCYIDLDSYWDNLITGGLEGDFSKLKKFAAYAKAKGLKPGIYWAPFTDWSYKSGPNRKAEGSNYKFGDLWTKVGANYHDLDGARALDPTHPGTQARIKLVIGKLKACGFELIKIDFLGHAAIESSQFYNAKITTGMQAYAEGMKFLVKQLDHQMLIYAAISPSLASGRYVHVRRIACDAFKSINDTQYTLNSVTNGWWQTHLYDYIDADHVVFGQESEAVNTSRLLSALVTGTLITGDDFSKIGPWRERAKTLLQDEQLLAVIKNGKAFTPVEGNQGKLAASAFLKKDGKQTYLALFNYDNDVKKLPINFARMGLVAHQQIEAENLLTKEKVRIVNLSDFTLQADQAVILRIFEN